MSIYDKFKAWTDNQDGSEDGLSMDVIWDDITLYWLTNSGAPLARTY